MSTRPVSCAGEVVLFELLAWLQEQEQYWRADDALDEDCVPELLCEDSNVSTTEATAAQSSGCDEASSAAFCALPTSAYSTPCMKWLCCAACSGSSISTGQLSVDQVFCHAVVEHHQERLSLHSEEICIPGEP